MALTANPIHRAIENAAKLPEKRVDGVMSRLSLSVVELHTDNLERHVTPRPKVNFPMLGAVQAHDAEVAAAGRRAVLGDLARDVLEAAEELLEIGEGMKAAEAYRLLGDKDGEARALAVAGDVERLEFLLGRGRLGWLHVEPAQMIEP